MLNLGRKWGFRRLLPIIQVSFFAFGLIFEVASGGSGIDNFLAPLSRPYSIALSINAPAVWFAGALIFASQLAGLVLVDSHAAFVWFTLTGLVVWGALCLVAVAVLWYLLGRWIDRRLKLVPVQTRVLGSTKKVFLLTLFVVQVGLSIWAVLPEGGGAELGEWPTTGLPIAAWSIFGAIVAFRLVVQKNDPIATPRAPEDDRA